MVAIALLASRSSDEQTGRILFWVILLVAVAIYARWQYRRYRRRGMLPPPPPPPPPSPPEE